MIYADNAATTKLSKEAIDILKNYLDGNYGNSSSVHLLGRQAKETLIRARETIAKNLNCLPSELTFTSGGSESITQAILSAAAWGKSINKTHIITSCFEHPAVLNSFKQLVKEGFTVDYVKINNNGVIEANQIEKLINDNTFFVSIMYANNEIGTIQPIENIGCVCRKRGILFHTDAVQAVAHIDIDVNRENIDMLSFSAHKFHGPKGIGVLYCRKEFPLTSIIYGGSQQRGKRGGTENVALIDAMANAFSNEINNLKTNTEKVLNLREKLELKLLSIDGSFINGDKEKRLAGITNIGFENIDGELLLLILDNKGIYISTGSACSSGSLNESHVLLSLGLTKQQVKSCIRISLSKYNSIEEMEKIYLAIKDAVSYLRNNK